MEQPAWSLSHAALAHESPPRRETRCPLQRSSHGPAGEERSCAHVMVFQGLRPFLPCATRTVDQHRDASARLPASLEAPRASFGAGATARAEVVDAQHNPRFPSAPHAGKTGLTNAVLDRGGNGSKKPSFPGSSFWTMRCSRSVGKFRMPGMFQRLRAQVLSQNLYRGCSRASGILDKADTDKCSSIKSTQQKSSPRRGCRVALPHTTITALPSLPREQFVYLTARRRCSIK